MPGRRTRAGATVPAVALGLVLGIGPVLVGCGSDGQEAPETSTDDTEVGFTDTATAELVFGDEVYRFDLVCESTDDDGDGQLLMAGPAAADSPGIGIEVSIAVDDGSGRAGANLGGEPPRRVELADADFDRTDTGWTTSASFDEYDRGSSTDGQLTIDGCSLP
jgi:hypothetical protein